MTLNKTLAGLLSVAGLTALSAGTVMAQDLTKIGSVTTGTSDNTVFTQSTTGTADTLSVFYNDGAFQGAVGNGTSTGDTVHFNATGGSTTVFGGGVFQENFTGGTFSLFHGTTDLLDGTLGASSILGNNGALSGGLNATGVTYTAASTALPAGFSLVNGTISLTYNVIKPGGYSLTNGRLNNFTASDSGVYSAVSPSAVPEPATIVPFVFGGLGLLVLAARKVRKTASVTA